MAGGEDIAGVVKTDLPEGESAPGEKPEVRIYEEPPVCKHTERVRGESEKVLRRASLVWSSFGEPLESRFNLEGVGDLEARAAFEASVKDFLGLFSPKLLEFFGFHEGFCLPENVAVFGSVDGAIEGLDPLVRAHEIDVVGIDGWSGSGKDWLLEEFIKRSPDWFGGGLEDLEPHQRLAIYGDDYIHVGIPHDRIVTPDGQRLSGMDFTTGGVADFIRYFIDNPTMLEVVMQLKAEKLKAGARGADKAGSVVVDYESDMYHRGPLSGGRDWKVWPDHAEYHVPHDRPTFMQGTFSSYNKLLASEGGHDLKMFSLMKTMHPFDLVHNVVARDESRDQASVERIGQRISETCILFFIYLWMLQKNCVDAFYFDKDFKGDSIQSLETMDQFAQAIREFDLDKTFEDDPFLGKAHPHMRSLVVGSMGKFIAELGLSVGQRTAFLEAHPPVECRIDQFGEDEIFML